MLCFGKALISFVVLNRVIIGIFYQFGEKAFHHSHQGTLLGFVSGSVHFHRCL
jgi:hypothetical protein